MGCRLQIDRYNGSNTDPYHLGYRDEIASGRVAFAHLIRQWHGRNGWSHRVLPGLAEALELGRVHNSQLSMLRNGKLASPGPEVFLALGRINRWLAAEAPEGRLEPQRAAILLTSQHGELCAALAASALPVQGEDGIVLGPGELLEVFVGFRQPPAGFDLRIDDAEAAGISAALALLLTAGRPWRLCRDQLLAAYPVEKRQRRERFASVMTGQADYAAPELAAELADLRLTLAALGAAGEEELSADRFLALLRQQARDLQPQEACPRLDLASEVRRLLDRTA
jgi:hypothetical protein